MLLSCVRGRTLLSLGLAGLLLALEGDHQTKGGRWKLVVLLSVLYIPLKNLGILVREWGGSCKKCTCL